MAAALAGPPARCAARPVHAAAGAVTEREIRRTDRRGRLPALDAVRGGLPGTAAGGVAPNQRLWDPHRLPHLCLSRIGAVAPAALRDPRPARTLRGALRHV